MCGVGWSGVALRGAMGWSVVVRCRMSGVEWVGGWVDGSVGQFQ